MASYLTGWQNQQNAGLQVIYFNQNKQKQYNVLNKQHKTQKQLYKIRSTVRSRYMIQQTRKLSIDRQKQKSYKKQKQNLHILTLNSFFQNMECKKNSSFQQKLRQFQSKNKQNLVRSFEQKTMKVHQKLQKVQKDKRKFTIVNIFEKIQLKNQNLDTYNKFIKLKQRNHYSNHKQIIRAKKDQLAQNKNSINKFNLFRQNSKLDGTYQKIPSKKFHSIQRTNKKQKNICVQKYQQQSALVTYVPVKYQKLPPVNFPQMRVKKSSSDFCLYKSKRTDTIKKYDMNINSSHWKFDNDQSFPKKKVGQ